MRLYQHIRQSILDGTYNSWLDLETIETGILIEEEILKLTLKEPKSIDELVKKLPFKKSQIKPAALRLREGGYLTINQDWKLTNAETADQIETINRQFLSQ